jgi:hypothetical protein
MTAHALKMASHLSRRRFLERGALLALGSTAVLAGAPTAAASARRESRRDSPDVCAEFCQPINSGPWLSPVRPSVLHLQRLRRHRPVALLPQELWVHRVLLETGVLK